MPAVDVLVIDDNRAWASTVAEVLRRRGLSTRLATDGHRALKFLKRCRPKLLISDVNMPGMDGFEILRRLRHSGDRTPVIVLSAEDPAVVRDKVLKAGASLFLHKPTTAHTLLQAVNSVFHGR
ncbi:MAG: response regulator [Pirellulales bacterium]|nr:response regulator [Pirellulales bacterium]